MIDKESGVTSAAAFCLICSLVLNFCLLPLASADPIVSRDKHGNVAVVDQGGDSKLQPKSKTADEAARGVGAEDENDIGTTGDQDDLDILRDDDAQVYEDEQGNVAIIEQDDAPPATLGPPPID